MRNLPTKDHAKPGRPRLPSGPQAASPTRGPDDGDPKRHFLYRKTNFLHRKANFPDSQIIRMPAIPPIPTGEDHAKPGRRRLPSGPRGRLPHPEGNTTADRPDRNEDMMSGARQHAARSGASQGPARPTRDDHRPAVHTTGLRTPASSTRPAQRHGPDGPPSCVRQIGTTHKDGGTVRPPEGKDDGRQEEHRMRRLRRAGGGGRSRAMRRLRQDPMRGLPVRMRRLPCHRMH
ncbi:hypothetical protein HMPREF1494_2059 [Bifidobacterium sp. MSTE12]|nr:hypothetical protein HMPREF1494_2059 [Bifidobacterium sp. MSTE12]